MIEQERRRDQPAHAVPEEEQRLPGVLATCFLKQRRNTVQINTETFHKAGMAIGLAVPVMVKRENCKTSLRQVLCDVRIAAAVLAKPVYK